MRVPGTPLALENPSGQSLYTPAAPDWYHNLLARPIGTVELGPEPFKVRARTARPKERDELAKAVPYLEQQQRLTERKIPIVVLERI